MKLPFVLSLFVAGAPTIAAEACSSSSSNANDGPLSPVPEGGVDSATVPADDADIHSDAYRLGEAMCMTAASGDTATRQDCQYSSYASRTPTAAQKSLVMA